LFVLAASSVSRLALNRLPFLTYVDGRKETTNMGKSNIVGTWFGIFVFIAIMLGSLEHASKTDPSGVDMTPVGVMGVVIPPFLGLRPSRV
jgi:hypothetical protein